MFNRYFYIATLQEFIDASKEQIFGQIASMDEVVTPFKKNDSRID